MKKFFIEALKYLRDLILVPLLMYILITVGAVFAVLGIWLFDLAEFAPDIGQIKGYLQSDYLSLVYTFLIVGILEETMFRYIIQDKILSRLCKVPWWLSIVIASILFGWIHVTNPGDWIYNLPQIVGTGLGGLVLGYYYQKRDLLFVILAHALYDFGLVASIKLVL